MGTNKFTLIEIMFAVAILIILIGIGSSSMSKVLKKSADAQIKSDIQQLKVMCEFYKEKRGFYPINDKGWIISEGLRCEAVGIKDGYYLDPYDNFYKMIIEDDKFTIFSEN